MEKLNIKEIKKQIAKNNYKNELLLIELESREEVKTEIWFNTK